MPKEDRLKDAKSVFDKQGHSGLSASLLFAMLREFCPNGTEVVNYIK